MSTRQRLALLFIFALALTLRLSFLFLYAPTSPPVSFIALTNAEVARNLLKGRGLVENRAFVVRVSAEQNKNNTLIDLADRLPAERDNDPANIVPQPFASYPDLPGYPALLAIGYMLGGSERYLWSQIIQSVLDAFACLLAFGIARRLLNPTAGLVAAFLYAISIANIFLANLPTQPGGGSFFCLLIAYGALVAWQTVEAGKRPWLGMVLVVVGTFLGTMITSTPLPLPGILFAAWLVINLVQRKGARKSVGNALYMLIAQVIVVVLILPYTLYNYQITGQISFTRGTSWQLVFAGLGEVPNKWGLGYDDKYYFDWIEKNCPDTTYFWRCEPVVRNYILSQVVTSPEFPLHVLRLWALRAPRMVLSLALLDGNYQGVYNPAAPQSFHDMFTLIMQAINALMRWTFLLAAVGLVAQFRRKRGAETLFVFAPTVWLIGWSLTLGTDVRHTAGGLGLIIVLAGSGIYSLFEFSTNSVVLDQQRPPAVLRAMSLILFALLCLPLVLLLQPTNAPNTVNLGGLHYSALRLVIIVVYVTGLAALGWLTWRLLRSETWQHRVWKGLLTNRPLILGSLVVTLIVLVILQLPFSPLYQKENVVILLPHLTLVALLSCIWIFALYARLA